MKKLTQHAGDCTIYASLENGNPTDGICTCGYGLQKERDGDFSQMYSAELERKLEEENKAIRRD